VSADVTEKTPVSGECLRVPEEEKTLHALDEDIRREIPVD